MTALAECVSLDTWRKIAEWTVADALAGDDKARLFLARYPLPAPGSGALRRAAIGDGDVKVTFRDLLGL